MINYVDGAMMMSQSTRRERSRKVSGGEITNS